ncbi:MAG TPA: hypothetical protein VFI46_02910 [Jiangellaceae bacterium]|nr:hypothetical protein [Jiangellaceae bacterium]
MTTQVVAGSSGRLSGRHRARRRVLPWPLLVLHMRARQLGWIALGPTVVALVGWWAAHALVYGDVEPDPDRRIPVAVAAPLLAAVLASIGLGGADEELERTTAWRWREARCAHIVAATLLAALALASIGTWEPANYGAQVIVRNVLGCFGVVAFSTVILGARLAWAPLFGYVATVYLAAPKPPTNATAWWTWPIQPASSSVAWWTALTLFVLGAALYAIVGARVTNTGDD